MLGSFSGAGQSKILLDSLYNIVPNNSFELLDNHPLGWFYNGKQFNRVMKYWYSPTAASPDVYCPKVKVPNSWQNNGFSKENPYDGANMVGITMYGCQNGKPHCREYIEIQLIEPLVTGQKYYFEFFIKQLPNSLAINNIGFGFSYQRNYQIEDVLMELTPAFQINSPLEAKTWKKISGTFEAKGEYNYLTFGNFFNDENTQVIRQRGFNNYAYYYLDKILLRKVKPIIPVEYGENDLLNQKMVKGKTYVMNNIYFEIESWELLPRSYTELRKLIAILKKYPTMCITIIGHTDNTGSHEYNLELSEKRAYAIYKYLLKMGIAFHRLQYKGLGATKNEFPNDTEINRQKNRKVEFIVDKLK